tara:strand:- start:2833 stop:4026 length:1194 start_codon:yes stop_codon:yes gene_type:complete
MGTKIFIVSEFVDKKQNSTGFYFSKIASAILEDNPEVVIISSKRSCELAKNNFGTSVDYSTIESKDRKKGTVISRGLHDLSFSIKLAIKLFKSSSKGDIVISGSNPTLLLFLISFIKLFKKFKLVLIVHDIFPENVGTTRFSLVYSSFLRVFIPFFNLAFKRSDAIVAIGRDMKEVLFDKIKNDKVKIKYIPNFVDLNEFKFKSLQNKNPNTDKIEFNFFGNLGLLQGIENLLESISMVKNKNVRFNFIGEGSERPLVEKFINCHKDIDVNLADPVSMEDNLDTLLLGDVAIISLGKGMKGLCVPSKTYFSLAVNKPLLIISDRDSELDHLIKEHPGIGWFCEAGNPENLAHTIDKICVEGVDKEREDPFNVVKNFYDFALVKEDYKKLIKDLKALK